MPARVTPTRLFVVPATSSRDHHSAPQSRRPDGYIRAVVEGAADSALRMSQLLIGGQVQTSLNLGSIQKLIVLPPRHIEEASQVGEDRSRAILPIQPQQGMRRLQAVRLQIATDGHDRATQFFPVRSVAWVPEGAEPVVAMGLQGRGSRADDLPTLAESRARCTQGTQAALGKRPVWTLRQSTLTGGLARPIDVEDDSLFACSINKPTCLPLFAKRPGEQIVEKECAQGFDRLRGEARSKSGRGSSAPATDPVRRAP